MATLDQTCQNVAHDLLTRAEVVCTRIAEGLDSLQDPLAFDAFRIANRAIARAIRQRLSHGKPDAPSNFDPPKWRPFQLAFVLTNLQGIVDPTHCDRKVVDLLFFPTGGGKTEAYLGLAVFTLALRRLRDPSITSAGLSVLMRYTLRLLTLDQLSRAATLICALELERQQHPEKLGEWPFEIGLWVGMSSTPNHLGKKGDNRENTARYKLRHNETPIPLENCPWCGERFSSKSFQLLPNEDYPTHLAIGCNPDRALLHQEKRRSKPCEFQRQKLPSSRSTKPSTAACPASSSPQSINLPTCLGSAKPLAYLVKSPIINPVLDFTALPTPKPLVLLFKTACRPQTLSSKTNYTSFPAPWERWSDSMKPRSSASVPDKSIFKRANPSSQRLSPPLPPFAAPKLKFALYSVVSKLIFSLLLAPIAGTPSSPKPPLLQNAIPVPTWASPPKVVA
ncbi:MAG: hypothetical protein HC890_16710 [Chloroflexaceae bacterium]|nr:hypothetical protein [Chloroflexaceae bacterium]